MKTTRMLLLSSTLAIAALPCWAQGTSTPAERRAFFGDMHLHTTMSFDAWTFGTKVTPDQAYKFGKGETVMVPAVQMLEQGIQTSQDVPAKRAWPLDFMAVTDHSEYMGAMHQLDDPDSAFSQTDLGKQIKQLGRRAFLMFGQLAKKDPNALKAAVEAAHAWDLQIKAANDNYEPGIFTTFIAYEWSSSGGRNGPHLHRNVFFNADHAPKPFTSIDSQRPEDLWTYLESVRAQGIDVLAIPHNSNLSDGMDFDWNNIDGKPIDEAYAQREALNEPLAEIVQTKGSSDTRPELSPNDEFANFEIMDRTYAGEASAATHGAYIREAYGRGLVIQSKVGANPFKMGVVGASDIHNGLTASEENAFAGGFSGLDPHTMLPRGAAARAALGQGDNGPAKRPNGESENNPLQFSSPGLTGVWAEENNRNSIFAALKRKETFATSGERIKLRMFSGWGYDPKMIASKNWAAMAYANGVPMGADMAARPANNVAPKFALWAAKDPDGANLDRIQVIKLWLDGGDYKEKIFNVALSGGREANSRTGNAPTVGNTVNPKTAKYTNTIGATELKTVWQDPNFDPAKAAVYYARVLQIPTPRWSTYLAAANNLPLPAAPATIQERGWSSPIWYTPTK